MCFAFQNMKDDTPKPHHGDNPHPPPPPKHKKVIIMFTLIQITITNNKLMSCDKYLTHPLVMKVIDI